MMNSPYFLIQQTKKSHPKFKFCADEDTQLKDLVSKYGENNWSQIAQSMPNRNARQCKERWCNYLSPSICKSPWTQDEDNLLLEKYKEVGARWVQIAKFFPQRTDINIKNRYLVLSRRIKKKMPKKNSNPSLTTNQSPSQNSTISSLNASQANILIAANALTSNLSPSSISPMNSYANGNINNIINSNNNNGHIQQQQLIGEPSSHVSKMKLQIQKYQRQKVDSNDDENNINENYTGNENNSSSSASCSESGNVEKTEKTQNFILPPIEKLSPSYFPPRSMLPPKKAILGIQTRTLLHYPPETPTTAQNYL